MCIVWRHLLTTGHICNHQGQDNHQIQCPCGPCRAKSPRVTGSSPCLINFALALAAMTCCWFLNRRQPNMRCNRRGSKVVRFSAGPGVWAGGTGGRLFVSRWILDSCLDDSGVDEADINSSSLIGITSG
eukprot:scaffold119809_cov102-Cyclotella_meneghiniana.AAC.1